MSPHRDALRGRALREALARLSCSHIFSTQWWTPAPSQPSTGLAQLFPEVSRARIHGLGNGEPQLWEAHGPLLKTELRGLDFSGILTNFSL